MRKFFLTVGFSGLFPKAPGTVGSLVSLVLFLGLIQYLTIANIFLLTLLITIIAVKQIDIYEKEVGEHDSKEIVIDELAGMWLTLCIAGFNSEYILFTTIVGFLTFRAFDIYKPSIIGKIDREVQGGWGVMGDDIVAGFFAGLSTVILLKAYISFVAPLFTI
jgi:phosphatidylglycerophosphatase A